MPDDRIPRDLAERAVQRTAKARAARERAAEDASPIPDDESPEAALKRLGLRPPPGIDPKALSVAPTRCEVCRGIPPDELGPVSLVVGDVCETHDPDVRRAVALKALEGQIDPEHLHAPVSHLHPSLAAWDASNGAGVYLYGKPGRGKSDNASLLARKAFVQLWRARGAPPSVVWFPVTVGIERIKSGFGGGPSRFEAATLWETHLLVLDDIGMEQPTDWSRSLLYTIVNERMVHGLPTIYTSNLTVAQLADRLNAPPIASRIAGSTQQVHLDGPDWRLK